MANRVKRSLGITAGHRAELYYMGNNQNISPDNVKPLAKYGTDAIFIEKEDGAIYLMDRPAIRIIINKYSWPYDGIR